MSCISGAIVSWATRAGFLKFREGPGLSRTQHALALCVQLVRYSAAAHAYVYRLGAALNNIGIVPLNTPIAIQLTFVGGRGRPGYIRSRESDHFFHNLERRHWHAMIVLLSVRNLTSEWPYWGVNVVGTRPVTCCDEARNLLG